MATVADVMTRNPLCCTRESTLLEVARIMKEADTGVVPVVDDPGTKRLLGLLTDRDIVVRCVARGENPADQRVAHYFSSPAFHLRADATVEVCGELMEQHQIRRVPIVDENDCLVGIVSMADLANQMDDSRLGDTLAEISERDTRQIYSEVREGNWAGNDVSAVDAPGDKLELT